MGGSARDSYGRPNNKLRDILLKISKKWKGIDLMGVEEDAEEDVRDAEAKEGDPHDVPAWKRVKSDTKFTEIERVTSDTDS